MKPATQTAPAARLAVDVADDDTSAVFDTAEEALRWAVEVLRRRRLPRVSPLWNEMAQELDAVEQAWSGAKNVLLPRDAEERLGLAVKIMGLVEQLEAKDARMLKLWAMGDWADDVRLRTALHLQEKLRRNGVKVRMSYRYSFTQVGITAKCDRKTAWRRVQAALQRLGEQLVRQGVVLEMRY